MHSGCSSPFAPYFPYSPVTLSLFLLSCSLPLLHSPLLFVLSPSSSCTLASPPHLLPALPHFYLFRLICSTSPHLPSSFPSSLSSFCLSTSSSPVPSSVSPPSSVTLYFLPLSPLLVPFSFLLCFIPFSPSSSLCPALYFLPLSPLLPSTPLLVSFSFLLCFIPLVLLSSLSSFCLYSFSPSYFLPPTLYFLPLSPLLATLSLFLFSFLYPPSSPPFLFCALFPSSSFSPPPPLSGRNAVMCSGLQTHTHAVTHSDTNKHTPHVYLCGGKVGVARVCWEGAQNEPLKSFLESILTTVSSNLMLIVLSCCRSAVIKKLCAVNWRRTQLLLFMKDKESMEKCVSDTLYTVTQSILCSKRLKYAVKFSINNTINLSLA